MRRLHGRPCCSSRAHRQRAAMLAARRRHRAPAHRAARPSPGHPSRRPAPTHRQSSPHHPSPADLARRATRRPMSRSGAATDLARDLSAFAQDGCHGSHATDAHRPRWSRPSRHLVRHRRLSHACVLARVGRRSAQRRDLVGECSLSETMTGAARVAGYAGRPDASAASRKAIAGGDSDHSYLSISPPGSALSAAVS